MQKYIKKWKWENFFGGGKKFGVKNFFENPPPPTTGTGDINGTVALLLDKGSNQKLNAKGNSAPESGVYDLVSRCWAGFLVGGIWCVAAWENSAEMLQIRFFLLKIKLEKGHKGQVIRNRVVGVGEGRRGEYAKLMSCPNHIGSEWTNN